MEAELQRRDKISVHFAKSASLFLVSRGAVPGFPVEGRVSSVQFRCEIWDGCGHADTVGQYYFADDIHPFVPFAAPPGRRQARLFFVREFRKVEIQGVALAFDFKRAAHVVCVDELNLGWIGGLLYTHGCFRRYPRREDLLSDRFETHEHDVLVVGAGGAGLRAAIEALGQGASVGVVSKSLLGKAHTVMAEGGIAAAMANVDSADGWKPHFRDTMRGGKFLNNWRMAQLHAQEAPERVKELEQWGALFDRTEDGRILQRAFGGHTFRRLCHVGDRTGLEMIRTLQDRGVHMGFDVYMECTIVRLLTDGGRCAGALAYWRETGRFVVFKAKSVVMATGGIGKAWPITSNSWEYTGDGMALAYEGGDGAELAAWTVCGGRGSGGVARGKPVGRKFAFGLAGVWPAGGTGSCAAREANFRSQL